VPTRPSRRGAALSLALLPAALAVLSTGPVAAQQDGAPAPAPAPAPPAEAPAAVPSPTQVPADVPAAAPADPRVVLRVVLPDGRTVVVAEGDQEPRSIGSYAIRLYAAGGSAFATDRFIAGMVSPRNGSLERLVVEDLDRDGRSEVVVIMRGAGTGAFLSADVYSFASNRMARRASIASVPADADIVRMIAPRVRSATAP
jgi:hypothetical protein